MRAFLVNLSRSQSQQSKSSVLLVHQRDKNSTKASLSGTSENRAFERRGFTKGVRILQQDRGVAYLLGCQRLGPTFHMVADIHVQEVVTRLAGIT